MYDNEDGSAGSIITMIGVFLLAGTMFILIGYGIDRVILSSINMSGHFPTSQLRVDVINTMIMLFRAEPVIMLIGIGISHWVNSMKQLSGESSLGTLLVGAGEMIIITMVSLALTLYGGTAIEKVILTMTDFSVTGAVGYAGLYAAVQYTAPIFYGICFLMLCGAVIQFLVLCVQTVDYSYGYANY